MIYASKGDGIMQRKMIWTAILAATFAALPFANAQQQGGAPAPQGGAGGGGGGGQQDWRQRMAQRMQEQLGVNQEEWTALQPKIEKVQTLSMQLRFSGRSFGRGGPGGGQGGGGDRGQGGGDRASRGGGGGFPDLSSGPVATAAQDLRTLLENKDANADQIKAKLEALRAARAKVKDELTVAQKDLRELLTVRQEAVLVEMGLLD
jgi:hypothetical protein